jgi:hypothetical protein
MNALLSAASMNFQKLLGFFCAVYSTSCVRCSSRHPGIRLWRRCRQVPFQDSLVIIRLKSKWYHSRQVKA